MECEHCGAEFDMPYRYLEPMKRENIQTFYCPLCEGEIEWEL